MCASVCECVCAYVVGVYVCVYACVCVAVYIVCQSILLYSIFIHFILLRLGYIFHESYQIRWICLLDALFTVDCSLKDDNAIDIYLKL